jgi:hypothetical protein
MQTTVDPAPVKTRLDDNDRRLIARARQLAGMITTGEIADYFTATGDTFSEVVAAGSAYPAGLGAARAPLRGGAVRREA